LAQVDGGIVEAKAIGLGPQVEGVAFATAFEAVKHMLVEVG
jgi:hypothetical protein